MIRLARTGKKKQAYFRVVVAEKERAVGAKFIEILGNYNPHEKKLEINKERLQEFLKNGAQPSNRLALILKKEGVELPKWLKIKEKNKPPKKSEEEKKEEPKPEATETKETSEEIKPEEGVATETPEPQKEEAKEDKKEESEIADESQKKETEPEKEK